MALPTRQQERIDGESVPSNRHCYRQLGVLSAISGHHGALHWAWFGAALVVVTAVVSTVGVTSALGGSATDSYPERSSTSRDSIDERGQDVSHLTRGAPRMPFRGIVGGHLASEALGLLYLDSKDGNLQYVPLTDDAGLCGPGDLRLDVSGTEVMYIDGLNYDNVRFVVPWGDDAYPALPAYIEPFFFQADLGIGVGEQMRITEPANGRFQVSIVRDTNEYNLGLQDWPYARLVNVEAIDGRTGVQNAEDNDPALAAQMGDNLQLLGSDGRLFGITHIPYEPACGPQDSFIYDSATGELVACGQSIFGPMLANFDASYLGPRMPVFPKGTLSDEPCDRWLDLRTIAASQVVASRDGL